MDLIKKAFFDDACVIFLSNQCHYSLCPRLQMLAYFFPVCLQHVLYCLTQRLVIGLYTKWLPIWKIAVVIQKSVV